MLKMVGGTSGQNVSSPFSDKGSNELTSRYVKVASEMWVGSSGQNVSSPFSDNGSSELTSRYEIVT